MQLNRVNYKELNAKQKENYNFHKVASALAEYGYNSMRLNDDWQGADFIAVNGDIMIKVQLKGRFTLDKKYIGKDIYVAFMEDNIVKIYNHDDALSIVPEKLLNTKSWVEDGLYSWGETPKHYSQVINEI